MKKLILITICVLAVTCNSQTFLTRGQVYNFDVNDVFQVQQSYNNNVPNFKTSTILSKTITVNNDSLIYLVQVNNYVPPSCQTCSSTSNTSTVTLMFTNLNATAWAYNPTDTNYFKLKDTMYLSQCNRQTYESFPVCKSGMLCWDKTTQNNIFVMGCGGPYYTKNVPSQLQTI